MHTINDFIQIIQELILFFDEMISVETEKFKAVDIRDLVKLNESMKKEQAFLLKLRGLDKKREQIQADLSFQNKPFREIIPLLPPTERSKIEALFKTLEEKYSSYHSIADKSKNVIEESLLELDGILVGLGARKANQNTAIYGNDGNINTQTQRKFTSRKV